MIKKALYRKTEENGEVIVTTQQLDGYESCGYRFIAGEGKDLRKDGNRYSCIDAAVSTSFEEVYKVETDANGNEVERYDISVSLGNTTANASNQTTIKSNESVTLFFTPVKNFRLPETITVTGATYTWNKSVGALVLSNPTGNVRIAMSSSLIYVKLQIYCKQYDIQKIRVGSASGAVMVDCNSNAYTKGWQTIELPINRSYYFDFETYTNYGTWKNLGVSIYDVYGSCIYKATTTAVGTVTIDKDRTYKVSVEGASAKQLLTFSV